jgi:hypothetical protein
LREVPRWKNSGEWQQEDRRQCCLRANRSQKLQEPMLTTSRRCVRQEGHRLDDIC